MSAVRVAGSGLVSCFGSGTDNCIEALRAGREGASPYSIELPAGGRPPVNQVDRSVYGQGRAAIDAMLQDAIGQALQSAGYPVDVAPKNCALVVGCTSFLFVGEAEYRMHWDAGRDPTAYRRAGSAGDITHPLAQGLGVEGPVFSIHTACSSSANALIVARDILLRGEVEHVLVVGAEGLSTVSLGGFMAMMLLDPDGCRPFDAGRRGLQLGEAYAAVLLDRNTSSGPLLAGGANLCDIHHVTSASPDGSAMHRAMTDALDQAGIAPADIGAIKAHGTGSQDNDMAEAAALHSLFGNSLPPVSTLKRQLGHTLGACGVVELVAWLACLQSGFLPAARGFRQVDPALNITPLTQEQAAPAGYSLLNYFGFGGNYASLVLKHG